MKTKSPSKTESSSNLEKIFLILLFILSVFTIADNYLILEKDTTPFVYDMLNIYLLSKDYFEYVKEGNMEAIFYKFNKEYYHSYPPFLIFQSIPFYFLFGVSEDSASFSNSIHILLLLISTYLIGKRLENSYIGILSAIILLFIPGRISFSRVYLPDFALASFVALGVVFLLYSEFFYKTVYSVLFGITFGLGLLTKWNFFQYILPFMFIYAIDYFLKKNRNKTTVIEKKQIINILLSFVIIIVIIYPWYINNLPKLIKMVSNVPMHNRLRFFSGKNIAEIWMIVGWEYFFVYGLGNFFRYYLFLIIISSIYLVYKTYKNNSKSLIERVVYVSYYFLVPIISFFPYLNLPSNPRYLLPLLPLFSIPTGVMLYDISKAGYKIVIQNINIDHKKFFIGFIIIIMIICSVYTVIIIKTEKSTADPTTLYWKGLYVPGKGLDDSLIINTIKNLTSKTEQKDFRVVSLQSSIVMTNVAQKLRREYNFQVYEPIFCLTRPNIDIKHPDIDCLPNFSSRVICDADILIDSNKHLTIHDETDLKKYFPERFQLAEDILDTWNGCKNKFILSHTIKEIPLEDKLNSVIYIYSKNNT